MPAPRLKWYEVVAVAAFLLLAFTVYMAWDRVKHG